MKQITGILFLAAAVLISPSLLADGVTFTKHPGKIDVKIDGQFFTSYHFKNVPKPVLYPLMWTDGKTPMTRRYPMEKALLGESNDHHHHRSLWWGHRHVKGGKAGKVYDFWGEGVSSGKQVSTKVKLHGNTISSEIKWVTKAGETVATDSRVIRFHATPHGRMLDYKITIHASHGDLVLMDDKDAGMSIRVPDSMCVSKHSTAKVAAEGYMLNSEGVTGAALWGKAAKWVDYSGTVKGTILGVAIFDHPDNPRHPTTWHARAYGLCAANIFGKRHFERLKDSNAGNYELKKGESLTFKYRFYWHPGKGDAKKIETAYRQWVAPSSK